MSESTQRRRVGEEASKTYELRLNNGFIDKYLSGRSILDIGYKGYIEDVVPIVENAIGVELDYPGYDGHTLPFADLSQDAVFASHCLEHIEDFPNVLRDWFRVLKVGGFLVIMVPHQYLYEKRLVPPSRYNADHKRFYTPGSLMADVEGSLRPNTYRLRHLADNDIGFDYSLPPERHSGGCYELELVIEKIEAPRWPLSLGEPAPDRPSSFDALAAALAEDVVRPSEAGSQAITTLPASPYDLALYDFGKAMPPRRRILALKLDHFGDFIIGLPALHKLREAFPHDHIRLVVGSWNRAAAEACHLVDEVMVYDFFPENARGGWNGKPHQDLQVFARATSGVFDIAVDLRVDEDTRRLLEQVEAHTKCGIGSSVRFGFLDVVLPLDHAQRSTDSDKRISNVLFGPERFTSRMPGRAAFSQTTDFKQTDTHIVYGPYIPLPPGRYRAIFGLQMSGLPIGLGRVKVTIDVNRDVSEILASRTISGDEFARLPVDGLQLEFISGGGRSRYEFRVHAAGRPLRATMTFSGVRLDQLEFPAAARFHRADLHIGEQLSLLVQLLADRTRPLYAERRTAAGPPPPLLDRLPAARRRIVIAPVSNSDLRDWPLEHYVSLVRMLVQHLDCVILLVGSRPQTGSIGHIVQQSGRADRVFDLSGRTAWAEIPAILQAADLVICNNSGIGHLAASVAAPTLAVYSASHQPQEWGPRGVHSKALMAVLPCSPCGFDSLAECPHQHACMQGLLPQHVFAQAMAILDDDGGDAA